MIIFLWLPVKTAFFDDLKGQNSLTLEGRFLCNITNKPFVKKEQLTFFQFSQVLPTSVFQGGVGAASAAQGGKIRCN